MSKCFILPFIIPITIENGSIEMEYSLNMGYVAYRFIIPQQILTILFLDPHL